VDLVESLAGKSEADRGERVVVKGFEDDALSGRGQEGQVSTDYG
jgi:hypothetical protein